MIESNSLDDPWQCTFSNGDLGIVADTASEHGGGGAGIRPRELLEASLATCMNMTVRMVAEREGIDLDGVSTCVELDRSGDAETLTYELSLSGVDAAGRERLRDAARGCPIHETLDGPIDVVERER